MRPPGGPALRRAGAALGHRARASGPSARPPVGRTLWLATPFLAGIGVVYFALLREYDINFHLAEKPPAFLAAVGLVVLLVLVLLRVLVPRIVGWSLALPLVLFERVPPRRALAESARRVAGARPAATRVLVLWAAGAVLLSLTLPPLLFALGRAVAPYGLNNVGLVLSLMLVIVVLWAALNVLVSWVSAAAFALLLVVLGALALAAGGVGIYLLRGVRGHDTAVVIAHRGAAAYAPENTLAAVEKALQQKAHYVEIDVQETVDGELVVAHDSDFMKVANVGRKVWDATWAELQEIDIGSWFAPEFAGERVPHLRDVLERARGRGRVTIELKYYGHAQQLEQRVIDLVEQVGAADQVILMSLDYDGIRKVRALRPDWTVGLLTAKAVGDLTELDADFLAVNVGLATRRFVRRAHARGKEVYVWTVDDPVRMFQMLNLGVDGLITNRPDLAREVLTRRAKLSSLERILVGLAFHFGAAAPDLPADPEDT